MDGVHDMGGMHGFGPVPFEENDPSFHHDWERRVFGMRRGALRAKGMNLDRGRFYLESVPPALYLSGGYFERWLYGLSVSLLDGGLVTLDEVMTGKAAAGAKVHNDAPGADKVDPYALFEYRREVETAPMFKIGDQVHTSNPHPSGHIRLPRYARDKPGRIHLYHGAHVLPDTNASGQGECPTHLYTVSFNARDLWGSSANAKDKVFLDVWECHLESGRS